MNSDYKRPHERGNVLFLVLIAVALFSALSYAVVQSTRSGGGDTSSETKMINVSQLLQIPPIYRTAVQRMVVTQVIDGSLIGGASPQYASTQTAAEKARNLYQPTGGNMPYPIPPHELMDPTKAPYDWVLNSENEVKNIGSTSTSGVPEEKSVELMIFLPGLKKTACEDVNKRLGITGMPEVVADASLTASSTVPIYMENGGAGMIGAGLTPDAQLAGKAEGCFLQYGTPDNYVFYAVLIPR